MIANWETSQNWEKETNRLHNLPLIIFFSRNNQIFWRKDWIFRLFYLGKWKFSELIIGHTCDVGPMSRLPKY
jgi:hypothetical protein